MMNLKRGRWSSQPQSRWQRDLFIVLAALVFVVHSTTALSLSPVRPRSQLVSDLQTCVTPQEVLERVGKYVTPEADTDGSLSSLVLLRLSKQLIVIDNNDCGDQKTATARSALEPMDSTENILRVVTTCLATSKGASNDAVVEGFKSCSILARIVPDISENVFRPVSDFWARQTAHELLSSLEAHHLSGLKWAFDSLHLARPSGTFSVPRHLQDSYDSLNLPFRIIPGGMKDVQDISLSTLTSQVQFKVDAIRTASAQVVKERRQTAWEGDEGVSPFAYSGKAMPRSSWSPLVEATRNELVDRIGQYYDGCLLNLYPDGGSGMRYHSDPDQGTLWDYDTTVVSVGATRRFSFRVLPGSDSSLQTQPHTFVVMEGDVTHMFNDCQDRFQHTVKKADDKREVAARASLVFKRTWNYETKL
jgi:alkylated DNA repair dioxygenase AlkB